MASRVKRNGEAEVDVDVDVEVLELECWEWQRQMWRGAEKELLSDYYES